MRKTFTLMLLIGIVLISGCIRPSTPTTLKKIKELPIGFAAHKLLSP